MKTINTIFVVLCIVLFSSTLFSQVVGDYRTILTGNWSNAGNWERYNGTIWASATTAPNGSETITVQAADSVFINVVLTLTGTMKNQGKLGGTGSLTVANGGTYSHDQNGGSIPVCPWDVGSTCQVTGYVSGSKPNNLNQDFYHFKWMCTGQTATTDIAWYNNTIRGDVTIANPPNVRTQMTSPGAGTPNTITIQGNINIVSGHFASNGSSSSADITVNTYGNIIVIGDPSNIANTNFSISRGSGPNVTWNLKGNFSVSNATLQNSGAFPKVQKLSFAGTTTQTITLDNVTYGTGTSHFTMEVQSGANVNLGSSVISSSNTGSFLLLDGGTVATGHPGGIASSIQCTGASSGGGNSFSSAANYTFNGSAQQVTSTLMPTTVNNLTVNNPTTVVLSQPTTINGVLRLMAGVFDNTIPFTLGPSGSISFEGGNLLVSVKPEDMPIPESFFVDQNYPNPFNPSTTIRYGLPSESFVTVQVFNILGQEIATLFEGRQNAGVHELNFDASNFSSGVYIYRIQTEKTVGVKQMILLR